MGGKLNSYLIWSSSPSVSSSEEHSLTTEGTSGAQYLNISVRAHIHIGGWLTSILVAGSHPYWWLAHIHIGGWLTSILVAGSHPYWWLAHIHIGGWLTSILVADGRY